MKISHLSTDGLKQEYKVVVPADEIKKAVEDRLKQIGQSIKMPGFRPGKIPTEILNQRYGDDARQDALKYLVQSGVDKIIKENTLKIVTMPEIDVDSADEGKDLEYKAIFELLPDIQVKEFKDIKLKKFNVQVTDKQVDKHLNEMYENHRSYKPLEKDRASKEKDLVHVDIQATVDGAPFKGFAPHYHTVIGNDDIVLTGEFEKHLSGKKVNESFEVTETFPKDFKVSNLSNKEVVITAKITKIEEPKNFKLDDDFAKEFKCDNLEDLKNKLKEQLENQGNNLERTRLKRFLLDNLNEQYSFDLPQRLVDMEFEAIWKHLQEELAEAKREGTLDESDEKSEDELRKEYLDIAVRRVRLGLVITEVAKLNNIKINNQDIQMALYSEILKYPNQQKEVYDYYQKNQKALEALMAPVMEDKVVDHILNNVTYSTSDINMDDFMKEIRGIIPGYEEEEEVSPKNTKATKKDDSKPKVSKKASAK